MRLNCTVGATVGNFGMYEISTATTAYTNQPMIVSGYPGDKPQTQWTSSDKVRNGDAFILNYRADTVGGHSGSPVWHDRGEALFTTGAWAIGIHTFGSTGGSTNGGTRLRGPVRTNYVNWINQP
jgi:glutamyl endopeptidase